MVLVPPTETCDGHGVRPPVSDKPLLRALRGEASPFPPFWLMRQAGRYLPEYRRLRARAGSFLAFCHNPALAAEATLQPVRRFGMDGAVVFSDILLVPRALGMTVDFVAGEGPKLDALDTPADIARLNPEGLTDRLAPVYETLDRVREALPERAALIGFAGAPWTLAAYAIEGGGSRDFTRARRRMHADPESFARLIAVLERAVAEHLVAQIRAGAEAVQLFDSWAGVLAPDAFERWCIEPAARIAAAVKAACPGVPMIGFPRGAGLSLAAYAASAGMDAVSLDTAIPAVRAARALPPGMAAQGNLDPVLLAVGGPAMAAAVAALRRDLGGRPWVFNLGHGVLPETPPEHVAELAGLLRAEAGP